MRQENMQDLTNLVYYLEHTNIQGYSGDQQMFWAKQLKELLTTHQYKDLQISTCEEQYNTLDKMWRKTRDDANQQYEENRAMRKKPAQGTPLSQTQHGTVLKIFRRSNLKMFTNPPDTKKFSIRIGSQSCFIIATLFENDIFASAGVAKCNPDDTFYRDVGMKLAFSRAVRGYLRNICEEAMRCDEEKHELDIAQLEAVATDEEL